MAGLANPVMPLGFKELRYTDGRGLAFLNPLGQVATLEEVLEQQRHELSTNGETITRRQMVAYTLAKVLTGPEKFIHSICCLLARICYM
jgi:hypothetical protein